MKRILRRNSFNVDIEGSKSCSEFSSYAAGPGSTIKGYRLPTSDPESVHQILTPCVVFLGARPNRNTITGNKQRVRFNRKSNVYMINAIYSNLISLL